MSWKGWHGSSMSAVEELPIHTRVLALPRRKADLGWCPVITPGEGGHARFTYIHPQVIKPLVSQKEVRIGHVMWRGRDPPTHDLGWANPGVRAMGGRVVLDARWRGYGDGKRRGGKSCSGYCPFFWSSIARNPQLMGFILEFAAREGDIVCCNYGAHRSVATANILQIAFARRVNWKHASPFRCCSFCVRPEEWSIPDLLWDAFRGLPHRVNPCRLLAYKLALPGCLHPFEGYYLPNSESSDSSTLVKDQELPCGSLARGSASAACLPLGTFRAKAIPESGALRAPLPATEQPPLCRRLPAKAS